MLYKSKPLFRDIYSDVHTPRIRSTKRDIPLLHSLDLSYHLVPKSKDYSLNYKVIKSPLFLIKGSSF